MWDTVLILVSAKKFENLKKELALLLLNSFLVSFEIPEIGTANRENSALEKSMAKNKYLIAVVDLEFAQSKKIQINDRIIVLDSNESSTLRVEEEIYKILFRAQGISTS